MSIDIYLDSGDVKEIERLADKVSGFTTNPSLLAKSGVTDYRAFAKDVLALAKDKPVSFEVFAYDFDEMERQANTIASWGDNVYVKIPITTTDGKVSGPLIARLGDAGIKVNVTAIMTHDQMLWTRSALGAAPTIMSVFAGRIADTGRDPVRVMIEGIVWEIKLPHMLLWASAREVYNVVQAEQSGCDIITLSPALIDKLPMLGRDLAEVSLETVRQFHRDAQGLTL